MSIQVITERGIFKVRLYGSPDNPPLILLHGWPQTSYCWHHTIPHLDQFYVIAPDLRGMGESNRDLDIEKYAKDEMARDIFAIANHFNIVNFSLAGHDWGGAIAQEMAIIEPIRISKLIILNMVIINNLIGQEAAHAVLVKQLFRSSWYQFFMSIQKFPEAMIEGKEDIWVRFFSRGITNPIPEDAIEEYIRCYKIPNTITTTSNMYRNLESDRARWLKYANTRVNVPTCIIHGILDPVIIKEYLVGVEDCFTSVEIRRIKAGHFIVDEQPKQVGELMTDFLIQQ